MVSTLWKACQDGDDTLVDELLNDSTSIDIEIKGNVCPPSIAPSHRFSADHTGVTPLIQAVKGGHVNIVKALLAKGADPTNASAQARPETYTTDPYILHLLAAARGEPVMSFPDPAQYFSYPPYAPYHPPPQWYPSPPQETNEQPQPTANLPPPEVARNIPCRCAADVPPALYGFLISSDARYYPECRFGSACVFAHPQTPYFPGPLPPPAQYGPPPPPGPHPHPHPPPHPHSHPHHPPPPPPHHDPAAYPSYYPVPVPIPVPISPPFAPHAGHPHHPTSPPGHMRTHSEILSPPPFSPQAGPIPVPVLGPGGPGGAPGPLPLPVQYLPPPMSPEAYHMYAARRASVTSMTSYPSPVTLDPAASILKEGGMNGGIAGNGNNGGRHGEGRQRRGSAAGFRDPRGPSYAGRKPPCLFFPSGRCRNGYVARLFLSSAAVLNFHLQRRLPLPSHCL